MGKRSEWVATISTRRPWDTRSCFSARGQQLHQQKGDGNGNQQHHQNANGFKQGAFLYHMKPLADVSAAFSYNIDSHYLYNSEGKAPTWTTSNEVTRHVIPVPAGIHNYMKMLDSRLRGNDTKSPNSTFSRNRQTVKQTSIRMSDSC